jgi:hypothetical protein
MVFYKRVNPFTVQSKICNLSGLHRSVERYGFNGAIYCAITMVHVYFTRYGFVH